jgi:hypothetical protein
MWLFVALKDTFGVVTAISLQHEKGKTNEK